MMRWLDDYLQTLRTSRWDGRWKAQLLSIRPCYLMSAGRAHSNVLAPHSRPARRYIWLRSPPRDARSQRENYLQYIYFIAPEIRRRTCPPSPSFTQPLSFPSFPHTPYQRSLSLVFVLLSSLHPPGTDIINLYARQVCHARPRMGVSLRHFEVVVSPAVPFCSAERPYYS